MKEKLFEILACPDCQHEVQYSDKDRQFICPICGRRFNFYSDIPILFSRYSNSVENSEVSFYNKKNAPVKPNWMARSARSLSHFSNMSIGKTLHDKLRNKYIFNSPQDSLILNLGSGIDNIVMKNNFINFDIYPHENIDLCGDGHYLPFLSNSFEAVWLCAVLEHLKNPFQVSSEIYRVLKPKGFVLVSAPFICPLHGSPDDYFRYTASGLRSVFKEFKEVECGPTHTLPTGTLIEIISQYFSIFTNHKMFAFGIRHSLRLLLWPLKVLDFYLKKKSKAQMLSGGFAFLGKKELN